MARFFVFVLVLFFIVKDRQTKAHHRSSLYNESMSYDDLWEIYKQEMGKSYKNKHEESYRRKIWFENYEFVKHHNKKADSGENDYYLDMNPFCDMSEDEIAKYKFGLKLSQDQKVKLKLTNNLNLTEPRSKRSSSSIPDALNWVEKGVVSDVKDQGTCGACWSFVTTGALESHQKIKFNTKKSYSEQNLIDCSVSYGNDGCDGGLMSQAFQYIMDNKGIDSDSVYKYSGKINECKYVKEDFDVKIESYENLPVSESALKKAIATEGPVAVGIDANHKSFLMYKGGVYEEPACSSSDLNHAVLVVGYGSTKTKDYWIIKNSWGTKWGESGYARIVRNKKNHCGIASLAGYPILK